ncbi:DUF397 domain-containing protein [Streptomyces sp. NPDC015171]|uniref:DUF397 domain-containing protein n=1 Tax=Streptomyces sp. NPDC015171 TaxID=3364945 RepID=UPI0036F7AA3A
MRIHQDLTSARWRKSSYSGNTGGECVEVAGLPALVAVRDSKNPHAAALTMGPGAWTAFVAALSGEVSAPTP